MKKAAFFFDGFNLFHAIDAYGESYLKWLNLRLLAEALVIKGREEVVWCTAEYPYDASKRDLHRTYKQALEAAGVTPALGHFVQEPIECRAECKQEFRKPTEKASDVNVAIHLISDAHENLYDVAYLVTADSDQAATIELFKKKFPKKHSLWWRRPVASTVSTCFSGQIEASP